jgi:sRNA-binding protein
MPQDVNVMIDRLCATFPAAFNRQTPKPLKIGIGQELLAGVGTHPAFTAVTRKDLRRALAAYTRSFRYRKALAGRTPPLWDRNRPDYTSSLEIHPSEICA